MIKLFCKIWFIAFFVFSLFSCASSPKGSASYGESFNEGNTAQRTRAESTDNDRMVTYSLSLTVIVKNIEETRKILSDQVNIYKGFMVRETESSLSARIPTENMDNFVNYIKSLGKIENERKTGTDITDQYRDNTIRLENLKNLRNKYLALLEKANTVTEILGIEKELERVNTEIELLEGRIKYAEQSVAYSNITVYIKEKAKPGPIGWIFYGLYRGIKWLFIWD